MAAENTPAKIPACRMVDVVKYVCKQFSTYLRLLAFGDLTLLDITLLVVGTLAAIASGVPFPIIGILFGQLVDNLNTATCNTNPAAADLYQSAINDKVLQIVYIGVGYFVVAYLCVFCWNLTGERLAQRLREQYFKGLLRQEISFFDKLPAGEASARLTGYITTIQQGTSEKVSAVLNAVSFFVTAYIVAFTKNARLAGELVTIAPLYLLMTLVGGYYTQKYSKEVMKGVGAASSVAMESLSNMTVVHAFNANDRLLSKFGHLLDQAMISGIKKSIVASLQLGLLYSIAYCANALAFWQGSRLVADAVASGGSNFSVGSTYTVIFILVDASIILSQVAPFIHVFAAASAAFESLEKDMTRKSSIDGTDSDHGVKIDHFRGELEFRDVSFVYPSKVDQPALRKVSFICPARRHTAIVGLSGSGKSTIAGLMLRLYDPTEGVVMLDGHDIKTRNVASLRSHISIVQQDSTLLNRSILENIATGLVSSPTHRHLQGALLSSALSDIARGAREGKNLLHLATESMPEILEIIKLVEQATILADVLSFINTLDEGFGTIVGSNGILVSGGQKQRISLARALVKDPAILILDEATASLDSATELRVQEAINQAANSRTVVTIAHRLATVRHADNIIVMRSGELVEQGEHSSLLTTTAGEYANLIRLQKLSLINPRNGLCTTPHLSDEYSKGYILETEASQNPSEVRAKVEGNGDDTSFSIEQESCDEPVGSQPSSFNFLKSLFRPYVLALLVAMVAVVVTGGSQSAIAVIFGKIVGSLSPCRDSVDILSSGRLYGLLFFIIAIVTLLANCISGSTWGWIAEKVQFKSRVLSFRALIFHDQGWHESAGRSPTILLTIITKDGNAVGSLTGTTLSSILGIMVNLLVAIIFAHIIAWRIALVCFSVVPLMIGAGIMRVRSLVRFEREHALAFVQSIAITVEAVNHIEMVASYSLERELLETYRRSLQGPMKAVTLHTAWVTVWLAIAYAMGNFVYGLAYWWGAKQIIAGNSSQTQFFIVMMALLTGAQLWATMFTMAPDVSRAHGAIKRIAEVIGDNSTTMGQLSLEFKDGRGFKDLEASQYTKENLLIVADDHGYRVEFRNVQFCYPARPDIQVLSNLNIIVEPGQFAALVGPSGAGKSTIVSLIERLYLPSSGAIEIDGLDITKTRDNTFRDNIALVPQQTVLFDDTVRFNIALGARPGQKLTDSEIEEACRLANVHDSIMQFPEGYDTSIGPNGNHLSGGQRQRLAIARALVRKPRLLLLDESTSALDAESERLLQDGLDKIIARGNITVISIAHRIYTIHKADVIFFIEGGRCTAQGTHDELMNRNEIYRTNVMNQTMDN